VTDEIDAARPLDRSGSVAHDPAGTAFATRVRLLMGRGSTDRIAVCLVLFWLAGVCFLTVWILAGNVRIWRVVRRVRPVTDPEILDLLDDCRRQMGTRRSVRVIATDQVHGPALFGLVQPCLLLPNRILADMDRNELRYILLHELAHLRRHDILLGMVASALHVLHWFNPLIGYGFQRMRADRESACDGLALSRLHPNETSAYGHTVLRLIEQFLKPRPRLILTGFLGDRARITQRVAMISRFTKGTYRCSPLAIGLVGLLGCIGLTNGRTVDRPAQTRPEVVQPAESYALPEDSATAHEYANIKRIHIRHLETGQYLIANDNSVDCDSEPGELGLWEARFDGSIGLGHGGDVLLYSVSEVKYLTSDEQGNLVLSQLGPDARAYWIVQAGPLGVQVISQEFKNGYLRMDEQGQVRAVGFGRDLRSQWDIIQLDRNTETIDNLNK
jgi:beta-lactamase regulating signal transducer with metallopeptidase domain